MKIKKKKGPHEFMFWMDFRTRMPRVYKLLMKREDLRQQRMSRFGNLPGIEKKIRRIDLELGRCTESIKKAGFELEYQSVPEG